MVKIQHVQTDRHHVLEVEGVMDFFTIGDFDAALEEMQDVSSLTIDFSRLTFIDSTGIGAILRAIHLSQEQGFPIYLTGMNEEIREMFETVGVLRVLEALQKGE
jgi:anti-anti-sigma factor